MLLENYPEVLNLTPAEKLILVSELWNDLAEHPEEVSVSREILEELDRRMEHFEKHPEECTTWDAIKLKLTGSKDL